MALAGREVPPAVLIAIRPGPDGYEIPVRGMKQVPGSRRLRGMHAPTQPIRPIATDAMRRVALVIVAVVLIFGIFPAVLALQVAAP